MKSSLIIFPDSAGQIFKANPSTLSQCLFKIKKKNQMEYLESHEVSPANLSELELSMARKVSGT